MRPTVKLGEICQIRTGKKDANYGTDDGQYAFFTCGKEILKAPDYSFDTEAILIAGNGDVGDCKYYKGKFEAYQRTYVLDDFDEKIDIHYAFHLLSGKLKGHVLKQIKGSAIPYIKLGALQNFEIPLPSLETQKAIVAKLDQIFAELDQTKSEIQKNLDNTDELWKSTLNQAFQGDWEMKKLGEVAEIQNGGTPKTEKKEYWNGDILWITPKDMGELNSRYVDDTFRKISNLGLSNSSAKLLPIKSVILSSRAPIGYVAINTKPISTNQGCKGIIPNDNLKAEYLYYFLILSNKLLNSLGSGATFKELSSSKLGEVEIPVPPLSEQEKIVEHLDQVSKEVKALKSQYQSQLDNLEELKKSVLDKAFRGELGE